MIKTLLNFAEVIGVLSHTLGLRRSLGVNVGDGALSYRPEEIAETYYSYSLTPGRSR